MSYTDVEFCPWCGRKSIHMFAREIIGDAVGPGYLCYWCGTSFMVQENSDSFPENETLAKKLKKEAEL